MFVTLLSMFNHSLTVQSLYVILTFDPFLHLTLPSIHLGGPAADPGEARAQPGGPEEVGGDQGVLAGSGEHHPIQSPPAL